MTVLDRILGIASVIRNRLGEHAKDWGRFAAGEPLAAAELLDFIAVDLTARAKARKRQNGWIARRLRARATAFRQHAGDLRDRVEERICIYDPYRPPGS